MSKAKPKPKATGASKPRKAASKSRAAGETATKASGARASKLRKGADGSLRVETGFAVLRIVRGGTTDVFASGRYFDEVVQEEGGLKLARRDVVCDSSRIDTLLAIPL